MKVKILQYEYDGIGLLRAYKNSKWVVGLKNWKPENDRAGIDRFERHNETDELFVLLKGSCTLLYAAETPDGGLNMEAITLEPLKVYGVPCSMWHSTVMDRETRMILIEDANTGPHNSEKYWLDEKQMEQVRALIR